MPRSLVAALAALLLVPAAASAKSLPRATPIDLGAQHYGADPGLPDPFAQQHIPSWLRAWSEGGVRSAASYPGPIAKEQKFQDQDGHILTLATDNGSVDLTPFANLLASTYHHDEIELIKVFVTNTSNLEDLCGSDAVACYAPDPGRRTGLMVVSYQSNEIVHAVIHEYGHHIDNNTWNLAGINGCPVDGDGSRRWFFARQMADNILRNLTCNPNGDWGTLLPEVYAEDYAQMAGIPRSEYHPAIVVRPPSALEKAKLKADIDRPFLPKQQQVKSRSSSNGTATFSLRAGPIPVFISAKNRHGVDKVKVRGCHFENFSDVFKGRCRLEVRTFHARQRFSFKLVTH